MNGPTIGWVISERLREYGIDNLPREIMELYNSFDFEQPLFPYEVDYVLSQIDDILRVLTSDSNESILHVSRFD